MQNEKGSFGYYNEFEYIEDFETVFEKIVYDTTVFGNLDNNLLLCIVKANKNLLLVCLIDEKRSIMSSIF